MPYKLISVTEYVTKANSSNFRTYSRTKSKISKQSVHYRIKNNRELPDVYGIEKVGNQFLLKVKKTF
jgi:hypothetical protein